MVLGEALALQQDLEPPIAKPAPGRSQLAQPLPQPRIFHPSPPIPACRPMYLHQPAGASLRNHSFRAHHSHRLPLHLRAYHFFVTTACNARLSSSNSATACFSCRFSSSSCRSRRASLTSIPPYFAFQRYRLPRVIPCRRHRSSGAVPASASLRMAMICSSLNRLLRTTPPLWPRAGHRKWKSHISAGLLFGGQVTEAATSRLPDARSAGRLHIKYAADKETPYVDVAVDRDTLRAWRGIFVDHEGPQTTAEIARDYGKLVSAHKL